MRFNLCSDLRAFCSVSVRCIAVSHALAHHRVLFTPPPLVDHQPADNLAANYSRELADYIIYVIDVAGGDKIPRKGGPGITQSDLLVINKTDLAEAVGADLEVSIISRLYPITK